MPIYEYKCDSCHKTFEQLVYSYEKEPSACPVCNYEKISRLISMFSMGKAPSSSGTCGSGHSHGSGGSCGNCSSGSCSSCK